MSNEAKNVVVLAGRIIMYDEFRIQVSDLRFAVASFQVVLTAGSLPGTVIMNQPPLPVLLLRTRTTIEIQGQTNNRRAKGDY